MAFGKQIIRKLDTSMYKIAAVVHAKDFNGMDNQVQKFITDVKKKLTKYEKHAQAAILTGEDTDITLDEVEETVKEARHAVDRVTHIQAALDALDKWMQIGGSYGGNAADCIKMVPKQKKNMALDKQISKIREENMALRKQITAMYEIAAVLKSEDFNNIGTAARKSITRLLKKLTYYEQKAHATMLTGEDTLITLEQVRDTVSWAMHGLALVRFIHDKSA